MFIITVSLIEAEERDDIQPRKGALITLAGSLYCTLLHQKATVVFLCF